MSTITDKTSRLFKVAWESDDELGYPNDVRFIAADEDWADEAIWRSLSEGHPTLVVDENIELLLTPRRRSPLDRLRNRIAVDVTSRVDGQPTPYATISRLGRHPVREMRRLAHAA